jgi:hypothetical protein
LVNSELNRHQLFRKKSFGYPPILCIGLIVIALFLFEEWRATGGFNSVSLDDSWIHYRFASNLRTGNGFSFNPGVPMPGSTSPLWVLILGLVGSGFLIPSKVLGILSYLGTGVVVYELGRLVGLRSIYAILAGMSILVAGRFAWAAPSGMETTTFALVSLVALWLWVRDVDHGISPVTSIVFGLACLLRPEGYLLVILSGLVWLVTEGENKRWKSSWPNLFRHFVIAGAVILPYFVFSWLTTGHVLPNTFYAKSRTWGCQPSLGYFLWIGAVFLLDNPVATLMAAYGLVIMLGSGSWKLQSWVLMAGIWMLSLPLVYGFLAPCISGYYTRYTTPLIPAVMLFGALGGQSLEHKIPVWLQGLRKSKVTSTGRTRLPIALMVEGIFLALIPTLLFWAPFYAQSVADIQTMHVRISHWLAENTSPTDVLALNDIGAIGFIADRKVIDLGGLISPEVLPLIEGKSPGEWDEPLSEFLRQQRPNYLAIFPNWYPNLVESLPVEQVYQVRLGSRMLAAFPNITVVGGGEMDVYKLNWDCEGKP